MEHSLKAQEQRLMAMEVHLMGIETMLEAQGESLALPQLPCKTSVTILRPTIASMARIGS